MVKMGGAGKMRQLVHLVERDQRAAEGDRQTIAGAAVVAPPELPGGAADEHLRGGAGVQHPVVALPGVVVVARHFDEALVQRQVVADGVLPALAVVAVVGEAADDVVVDAREGEPLLGVALDGHHDQRVVAVWRLRELHCLLLGGAALTRHQRVHFISVLLTQHSLGFGDWHILVTSTFQVTGGGVTLFVVIVDMVQYIPNGEAALTARLHVAGRLARRQLVTLFGHDHG